MSDIISSFFDLVGKIVWPLFCFCIVFVFKEEIKIVMRRVTSVSFGDKKIDILPTDKGKLLKATEIRKSVQGEKQQAQLLLDQGVFEPREFRILRSLVGDDGRALNLYKDSGFYQPAIASLVKKGLIFDRQGKYYFTELGQEVMTIYLSAALKMLDVGSSTSY
ncbi:MAG: hypothetical protein F6K11_00795 [Leptolyngbya sp. SIO3F4]|nr:hypothetical protein [Leptolyngbya sp. SIO3F4]